MTPRKQRHIYDAFFTVVSDYSYIELEKTYWFLQSLHYMKCREETNVFSPEDIEDTEEDFESFLLRTDAEEYKKLEEIGEKLHVRDLLYLAEEVQMLAEDMEALNDEIFDLETYDPLDVAGLKLVTEEVQEVVFKKEEAFNKLLTRQDQLEDENSDYGVELGSYFQRSFKNHVKYWDFYKVDPSLTLQYLIL